MTGVQTFPTPLEAHSISEISDLVKKYSQSEELFLKDQISFNFLNGR